MTNEKQQITVTVSGPSGSGKSIVVAALISALQDKNVDILFSDHRTEDEAYAALPSWKDKLNSLRSRFQLLIKETDHD